MLMCDVSSDLRGTRILDARSCEYSNELRVPAFEIPQTDASTTQKEAFPLLRQLTD